MTDPTGRPRADALPADEHREPQAAMPTDLESHPLSEIPRPFTREHLEADEREIRDGILRMGSIVAERTIAAVEALERHDADAALAVIQSDAELNREQERVSSLVSMTIARQQPVARDLRFLMALDHVAYDLERMGDHASSVAKQARKLAPHPPLSGHVRLPEMGRLVAQQVRDILGAVVDTDEVLARAVAKRDDDVDALYHSIFEETLRLMQADPANVDPGARILFAAHYLERTGDRVTNIAEDIVFLATGAVEDLNP
jgi:phosphate transport system protein